MKLLISFATYPRDGKTTYRSLLDTFTSLVKKDNLEGIHIDIWVVGDDYPNIDELRPIFENYHTTFFNINQQDALRHAPISKEVKWAQAVQRTKIFILEKALTTDYDYILMSSDDDTYMNHKISKSMAYIKANHYPDFVFNRGIHNETPQSKHMIFPINDTPYPEPGNCIASGCLYRVSNKAFLQTIINFRKSCWLEVELYKTACKNENIPYMRIIEKRIKPEDYQLWDYLARHFKDGVYTSLFIPEILIHHGPERSLYHYL